MSVAAGKGQVGQWVPWKEKGREERRRGGEEGRKGEGEEGRRGGKVQGYKGRGREREEGEQRTVDGC